MRLFFTVYGQSPEEIERKALKVVRDFAGAVTAEIDVNATAVEDTAGRIRHWEASVMAHIP